MWFTSASPGWIPLQPRAITRDLDWGIPVPLEEAKGKVLYVCLTPHRLASLHPPMG